MSKGPRRVPCPGRKRLAWGFGSGERGPTGALFGTNRGNAGWTGIRAGVAPHGPRMSPAGPVPLPLDQLSGLGT